MTRVVHSSRGEGRGARRSGFLAGVCVLCLAAGTQAAAAPAAAGGPQESEREIREKGFRCFAQGEFTAAIPEFEQLIRLLSEGKNDTLRPGMEQACYTLGLCYFFTANLPASEKTFRSYIQKHPHAEHTAEAFVYVADCLRLEGRGDDAIKAYYDALRRYDFGADLRTDIYYSIAQCHLMKDDWGAARSPLHKSFRWAPDSLRRNRAATLLATAYLKTLNLEKFYSLVPFLLQRDSPAARSIAFNMAAMEAGNSLFSEERYREALWVYRLVYPREEMLVRTKAFLEFLQKRVELEKRGLTDPRRLMRLQEWVGETEFESKAMSEIEDYDLDLEYRVARGYMEAGRYREGRELFLRVSAVGGKEKAEEALYLAFACSSYLSPWTRAYEISRQYMEKYSRGQWYDDLTLLTGQMYAREQNWPEVINLFGRALQNRPNHSSAAEGLFLLGYAHFMEERFDPSVARFRELRTRFPGTELLPGAVYWTAMALLFNGNYEEAAREFDEFLLRHPDAMYLEDASFRQAICNYALGRFDIADEQLDAFLAAHPASRLAMEAWMTRGDIAGVQAKIDDAVGYYRQAMKCDEDPRNTDDYNYCAFQAGQILFGAGKFKEAAAHYQRYIEHNRAGANLPLAAYWIGRTRIETGEPVGAASYYKAAVLQCGAECERNLDKLLQPENIANAGPAVLASMLDGAIHRNQTNLAVTIAQDIAAEFAGTEDARNAQLFLARNDSERLRAMPPGKTPPLRDEVMDAALQSICFTNKDVTTFPDALLRSARGYEEQNEPYRARDVYYEVAKLFPRTDWSAAAIGRLKDIMNRGLTTAKETSATGNAFFKTSDDMNKLVAQLLMDAGKPPVAEDDEEVPDGTTPE